MARSSRILASLVLFASLALFAAAAPAASLNYGDIVVSDDTNNTLWKVDRFTGARSVISSGGSIASPFAVVATYSHVYFVDSVADAIIKVDVATGSQSILHSLSDLGNINPNALAVEANGNFLIGDLNTDAIYRYNPATNTRTLLATLPSTAHNPTGIDVHPLTGQIIVVGLGVANDTSLDGRIISIHPVTGVQTELALGGKLIDPRDVAVLPDGRIFVADSDQPGSSSAGQIIRFVAPSTQTAFTFANAFTGPFGIAADVDGNLIFTDPGSAGALIPGRVIRLNADTGAFTILSESNTFRPLGIAVVVPEPASATLALLALPLLTFRRRR